MILRNLKIERLYPLGDYKNIKFTDEIDGIPADVALNPEVVSKLRLLQMVGLELNFKRYLDLNEEVKGLTQEKIKEYLEKVKLDTTNDLVTLLNGRLTIENKGE